MLVGSVLASHENPPENAQDLPDVKANRFSGPKYARVLRVSCVRLSWHKLSSTERKDVRETELPSTIQRLTCSKHSAAVVAWKQASGHARCIVTSLNTILGGMLLNKQNPVVSSRNIQRKTLELLSMAHWKKGKGTAPYQFLRCCKSLPVEWRF